MKFGIKKTACLALAALAAAVAPGADALSLEEYKYFLPVHTNLIHGTVMGDTGDYSAVRYEDVAWLRNAFLERVFAISLNFRGASDFSAYAANVANQGSDTNNPSSVYTNDSIQTVLGASRLTGYNRRYAVPWSESVPQDWVYGALGKPKISEYLAFTNPSNVFSDAARLIETGKVVESAVLMSNVFYAVTNILERATTNGVSSVTNICYSSSNVFYHVDNHANRKYTVSDFCYSDYMRTPSSYDFHENLRPFRDAKIMSKHAITNAFTWLRDATDITDVVPTRVAIGVHVCNVSEYKFEKGHGTVSTTYGGDPPSLYERESETNYVKVVTNASLPALMIENIIHEAWSQSIEFSPEPGEDEESTHYEWEKTVTHETTERESKASIPSSWEFCVATPFSTNLVEAYGGINRLPLKKARIYCEARLENYYSDGGSWTLEDWISDEGYFQYGFADFSTNLQWRAMIPLGESAELLTADAVEFAPTNQWGSFGFPMDKIYFKFKVEDMEAKLRTMAGLKDLVSEIAYKVDPAYMAAYESSQRSPVALGDEDDDDPSTEEAWNKTCIESVTISPSSLYISYQYDFETELDHWKKLDYWKKGTGEQQ